MKGLNYSVAGTVVLFNPTDNVLDTITSYIDQVSKLYVMDNSVRYNASLIQKLKLIDKIIYVNNHGNKGIAAALNTGAQLALDGGFNFLLTMDQDTRLSENFVSNLMKALSENDSELVGIIAPRYTKRSDAETGKLQNVFLAMTSGNILNLAIYKKIGPFLEKLFIDHVDHEYCLRLLATGFKIVQVNDVEIVHRPGTVIQINFFGVKKCFSSHSPQRLYYYCRNGFYVANYYRKTFPNFRDSFYWLMVKEIFKIPFEKDKILRLRMIMRGFLDFKLNKFGPKYIRNK